MENYNAASKCAFFHKLFMFGARFYPSTLLSVDDDLEENEAVVLQCAKDLGWIRNYNGRTPNCSLSFGLRQILRLLF